MNEFNYAECIQNTSKDAYTLGKIYKIQNKSLLPFKLKIITDYGESIEISSWTEDSKHLGHNCFKLIKNKENKAKDKTIKGYYNNITVVKSSEGAIFEIGDRITVFTKNSPNKGKLFTIKGFRWNNNKTAICVITEYHGKNGIGLDKIELYSEPKKELSLLEQAKLNYPVGCRINNKKAACCTKDYPGDFICGHIFIDRNNFIENISTAGVHRTIYNKYIGVWAEKLTN